MKLYVIRFDYCAFIETIEYNGIQETKRQRKALLSLSFCD